MNDYSIIKEEIKALISQGEKINDALSSVGRGQADESSNLEYFLFNYQLWYTKAQAVIKQLSPDRLTDFNLLYNDPKRKELDFATYCISDALRTTTHMNRKYGPWTASLNLTQQIIMLRACLERFDSKVYDIQTILQADIFDSEIDSAKHLLKMGFVRAAGAICGVIIEKHFADVAHNHNITIRKKDPTISDYNDIFKDNVYDTLEWRKIQRLADIRNLCDHNKEREPTREDVSELINGTDRIVKTIF